MKQNILILDDDEEILTEVGEALARDGFEPLLAKSGAELQALVEHHKISLFILDLMLEQESGLEFARSIRHESEVGIIILTGKIEETDRIVGLEIGADDYVVKPFEPRELVARIRSVLRRASKGGNGSASDNAIDAHYEFDGWQLDPLKRRLTDPEGTVVPISTAEFRLLTALLEHPNQVMDRDRLLDMVQGREAHLFDRAVDNQISRLRRKVEVDSRDPKLIQTVWGGGYMLAAEVRRFVPES